MEEELKALWESTRQRVEEVGGKTLPPYPWCSKIEQCSQNGRCHNNPNCGE